MLSPQIVDSPQRYQQPTSMLNDSTLVTKARNDLTQFSLLYEKYAIHVYRYLLVRVGNIDDAQDLTSQTFMAVMKGIKSYRGQSPFLAWLFGIARNKAANLLRQRSLVLELDEIVETVDSRDEVDRLIDQQMAVEQVARKLQNLSPDRAEALSLRLFGGLEVDEIARTMGRRETAVRMLILRGLRDLRVQLQLTQVEPLYQPGRS